jgi:hypothetical protein
LKPTIKKKKIIVYGRPGVLRNLFNTIVEGLRIWQAREPSKNSAYEIFFAGEIFNKTHLSELENAHMVGKLSLDKYAELLNEAAIGISLMISPHPSYPPLEMASADCITITNAYECKDLSCRADNIISLDTVTPNNIAKALLDAVEMVDHNKLIFPINIKSVSTDVPAVDYNKIAVILQR